MKNLKNQIRIYLKGLLVSLILISFINKNLSGQQLPEWAKEVNQQVKSWTQSGCVIGSELLIIKNNKTILHEVYGWADKDSSQALKKNQIFRIHSMTKPFTGTAILMLAENNLLSINDRVSKYLNEYDNDKCRNITIKQLLNHTAGFTQPAYPKGSIDLYSSLEEAVTDLAKQGPKYEPGSEYHYSDGHSATLGLIVSKVSGEAIETFIEDKIFKPLKMKDSYCSLDGPEPSRERVCDTYYWKEGKYQKLWDNYDEPETSFFRASGGISTTALDYAKFLSFWMNKGKLNKTQILSAETVSNALQPSSLNEKYGLHWELHPSSIGKSSAMVFGHSGSSGTLAIAIPDYDVMVLYFTQSRGTLTANFLPTLIMEELGYQEKKDFPGITNTPEFINWVSGDYLVGKEKWTMEGSKEKLIFKSGRLVPLEFTPISENIYTSRFMEMRLEFTDTNGDKCSKFNFHVEGNSIQVTRTK